MANVQLAKLKAEYGYYEEICLADPSGELVASSNEEIIGKFKVDDRPYFASAMAGRISVSDALKSRGTGNPVFFISAPISEKDAVIGIIFSVVDISAFSSNFIDTIKVGQTGYAYMYNRDGIVIAHPDKSYILALDMKEFDFGKEMIKRKEGLIEYTHKDVTKRVAYKPVEELGWTVAVNVPTAEIMAPARALGRLNMILALAVTLAAAVLVYLVVNSITKKLNQVVHGLRDAAEGEGQFTHFVLALDL